VTAVETRFHRTCEERESQLREEASELEPQRRLRRLVDRLDAAIAACENAHLQRRMEVTDELAAHAHQVYGLARSLLPPTAAVPAAPASGGAAWPVPTRIDHLMDRLWTLQAAAFDALLPWRRELGEEDA
jgi:hypothetical protein